MRDSNGDAELDEEMRALAAEVRAIERLPAAWLDAAEGKTPVDELLAGVDATYAQRQKISELFQPLDPRVRDRLAQTAAEQHRGTSAGGGAVIPMAPLRRRWVWAAPAIAAAAVVALFLRAPDDGPAWFAGEVSVYSAHRDAPVAPGRVLEVGAGAYFYLDCRAHGSEVGVVSLRATSRDGDERIHHLGFSASEVSSGGALLHVLADLPPGHWEVRCGATEVGSSRFAWFARPVELVVR